MSQKIKGVVSYLALAFGTAWGLWEVPLRLGLSPRNPLFQLVGQLGSRRNQRGRRPGASGKPIWPS